MAALGLRVLGLIALGQAGAALAIQMTVMLPVQHLEVMVVMAAVALALLDLPLIAHFLVMQAARLMRPERQVAGGVVHLDTIAEVPVVAVAVVVAALLEIQEALVIQGQPPLRLLHTTVFQ